MAPSNAKPPVRFITEEGQPHALPPLFWHPWVLDQLNGHFLHSLLWLAALHFEKQLLHSWASTYKLPEDRAGARPFRAQARLLIFFPDQYVNEADSCLGVTLWQLAEQSKFKRQILATVKNYLESVQASKCNKWLSKQISAKVLAFEWIKQSIEPMSKKI